VISLLVPTRGRPDQLREMWHSAIDTAVDPDGLELVARVDSDDRSYDELRNHGSRGQVRWLDGPRVVLSEMWNEAYQHSHGEIVMHCADDIRFRTPAWDLHVNTAFDRQPDKVLFVYGRDGVHDQNLGTHGFLHRTWPETVGYFVPPYFSSDYNDLWLHQVAMRIGRLHYVPEIYTEHLHPAVNKGQLDQTHRERLERGRRDNVDQLYADYAPQRELDTEKLRKVMNV
jgi:hypothetical protein